MSYRNEMLLVGEDDANLPALRLKRFLQEQDEGSGGEDQGDNDMIPGGLGTVEILSIVICSLIILTIVVFLGSYALKEQRRRSSSFSRLPITEDDCTLHMVDYDELNMHNSRLTVNVSIGKTSSDA